MGLLGPLGANRSHGNRESRNARDTTARACPSPIKGSPLTIEEKRSFEDFVTTKLDDSDQPKIFANNLLDKIRKY